MNIIFFISLIVLCFASYGLGYANGTYDTRERIEKMLDEVINDVNKILESRKNGE